MWDKFKKGIKEIVEQGKEQANEEEKRKKDYKEAFKKGGIPIIIASASYLGGHPDIQKTATGNIYVQKNGLFFDASINGQVFVPIESIVSCEFKTEEQISKDVTLTRLLLVGIYAFGMKKKRVDKKSFFTLTFEINGIEITAIFESKKANQLVSAVNKSRIKAPQTTTTSSSSGLGSIEQIKQLAELKDQGILTEEEFERKKKELLSRM